MSYLTQQDLLLTKIPNTWVGYHYLQQTMGKHFYLYKDTNTTHDECVHRSVLDKKYV